MRSRLRKSFFRSLASASAIEPKCLEKNESGVFRVAGKRYRQGYSS